MIDPSIKTDTMCSTVFIDEQGQVIFPCRCGEAHTGYFAAYDFGQHECLHEADLVDIAHSQVLCPHCGKVWAVDRCYVGK